MPKKSYAYPLNIKPSNWMFLKNYNTELDGAVITLTDENATPL